MYQLHSLMLWCLNTSWIIDVFCKFTDEFSHPDHSVTLNCVSFVMFLYKCSVTLKETSWLSQHSLPVMLHVVLSPSLSVLHWDTEEEAVVMETTSPEAVPVHSKESLTWHSRVPTAEEVGKQPVVVFCSNRLSFQ